MIVSFSYLLLWFDFFSQINNSEHFKAFLLSFKAQHFSSSAHVNIRGSSLPGARPSFCECLWPLRIHLTSDLFTLLCYDLSWKPLAPGQACLCSELILFLNSCMQSGKSVCYTPLPLILIHQLSSNAWIPILHFQTKPLVFSNVHMHLRIFNYTHSLKPQWLWNRKVDNYYRLKHKDYYRIIKT